MAGYKVVPDKANLSQFLESDWDDYIRDDMNWIGGADGRGTAFPTTGLVDGMYFRLLVDTTNGIEWDFRYRSGSASTYKWEFAGGPDMFSYVQTSTLPTGDSTWRDFTTTPSITIPRSGDYRIVFGVSQSSYGADFRYTQMISAKYGAAAVVTAEAINPALSGGASARVLKTLVAADVVKLQVNHVTTGASAGSTGGLYVGVLPVRLI